MTSARFALAFVIPLAFASRPMAQVPDGWCVISSFRTSVSPYFTGPGGLWLCHPRTPNTFTQVSGLPPNLTGTGVPGPQAGASSVFRDPASEFLYVGNIAPADAPVELHRIVLNGAAVVPFPLSTFWSLGTAGSGGGDVTQAVLLPGGDVLVAVYNIVAGPLAGARLGRVSPGSGVITPVSLSNLPLGTLNALAIDAAAGQIYLGNWTPTSGGSVWKAPVSPLLGPAPSCAATPHSTTALPGVLNLAVDNGGQVIVGTYFGSGSSVFTISPGGVATTAVGFSSACNAVAVERATGNLVFSWNPFFGTASINGPGWAVPLGAPNDLGSGPAGGWGVISGIDVNHDPETFGAATPGGNSYTWATAPNPGGLPLSGGIFSVTLNMTPACAPGALAISFLPQTPPAVVSGIPIHVSLAVQDLLLLAPVPCAPSFTIGPFPIPPTFAGITLYLQTAHDEGGSVLAASSGLRITFL